jgi:RNA polymerase subunit RPABC4/transcription elongation factor Spt4
MFALLPPIQQFGEISAITIFFSFMSCVFILPTFLVLWARYRQKRGTLCDGTVTDGTGKGCEIETKQKDELEKTDTDDSAETEKTEEKQDEEGDGKEEPVKCGNCGAVVSGDVTKCPECDVPFGEEWFECPECRAKVTTDIMKCSYCGAQFKEADVKTKIEE